MKEQLISFETAKLAKKKGVKLDIDGLYWEDGNYDSGENALAYEDFPDVVSAPTQSLLQRWFREVHKISVEVSSGWWDEGKVEWEYNVYKKGLDDDSPCSLTVFKTYEKALEVGLQEALKLIK